MLDIGNARMAVEPRRPQVVWVVALRCGLAVDIALDARLHRSPSEEGRHGDLREFDHVFWNARG